ncbi:unnamed protein product [Miscanthus lutarioriparius]|uniref:Carboxypeptidase n=1 Tax=Miscanthus lutarioriparius TaxID=422564 RepID=A0A811RCN2_9POAL|nr:unnamed protein product [Miscanthus lutarioriparius]
MARGGSTAAPPALPLPLLLVVVSSSAFFACCCLAAPPGALVTSVPGFAGGKLPSKHYAGYVTVDEAHGRRLFYYLVESEREPAKDPVVLWLNGGPGCSSFDGFVYEHGPFNFEAGGSAGSLPKLHLNPCSWSKVSSVIYLDSPAGVGLSYSKNVSDYETGDLKTAADSHTFLLKWFQLYPEFLTNPFYIAGESYAGVYVPTLSHEVVKGIQKGDKPILNFKGYMVGNGVCDTVFDGNALVPFAHGMALISESIYKEANTACQGNYWNASSAKCDEALSKVDTVSSIGPWQLCTDKIDFDHDAGSMIIYHKNLTSQGYRALIYSGDHDMCVPHTGTEAWTASLGYGIVDSWRQWIVNEQVAGYTQGYENGLTFATIKGAGHTVPEYKPQESLAFYSRWLNGTKL